MRRRRPEIELPNHDRWLLSYADFITLLLALFVVLYALSAIDLARLEKMATGLRAAFSSSGQDQGGILEGLPPPRQAQRTPRSTGGTSKAPFTFLTLRDKLSAKLETSVERESNGPGVHIRTVERGLIVSLASTDFFPAGDVRIHAKALRPLDAIAAVLALSDHPLRVEGHTDDRPIASNRYPSNWELSSARAAVVARHLIERHNISPGRVGVAGFAQYRPVVPNDSAENRALNRRIDIVILSRNSETEETPELGNEEALRALLDQLPPLRETPPQ